MGIKNMHPGHSRRSMIRSLSAGSLLLPGLLQHMFSESASCALAPANSLAPKQPHFAPKAQRVIFIYLSGGFSHVDTFDPKPALNASSGKEISPNQYLQPTRWGFKKRGKCGTEISDLFPSIGEVAVRSMFASQ